MVLLVLGDVCEDVLVEVLLDDMVDVDDDGVDDTVDVDDGVDDDGVDEDAVDDNVVVVDDDVDIIVVDGVNGEDDGVAVVDVDVEDSVVKTSFYKNNRVNFVVQQPVVAVSSVVISGVLPV